MSLYVKSLLCQYFLSFYTLLQRIHHANHGLENIFIGLNIPLTLINALVVISLIVNHEIIRVPFELWLGATILLVSDFVLDWFMHKEMINASLKAVIGKTLAHIALKHTITYAALRTFLTGSATWNRTNKFKSHHTYMAAFYSTKEEFLIGMVLLVFIAIALILFPYTGLALMFLIGLGYKSMNYLTAPFMAFLSVWSMKRDHHQKLQKSSMVLASNS